MNSYLVNYRFDFKPKHVCKGIITGIYHGKTPSEAVKDLEKAGAKIYSIILMGAS